MGYHMAGFDIVGVDINPQPNYPFEFHQADAMTFPLDGFDAIHASPPCQHYSTASAPHGNHIRKLHPDLVEPIRNRLLETELPYIMENVIQAPLIDPILLCGTMFPILKVYRHRKFESNISLVVPPHPKHVERLGRASNRPNTNGWMTVAGHITGIEQAKKAMGIDWMTGRELVQAIPPVYTSYLGKQLITVIRQQEAA